MTVGFDESDSMESMNFFIEGVKCSKCVQKLESLGSEQSRLLDSRFDKSRSLLHLTPKSYFSPELAIQWIESKGYKAYFVESSEQTEKLRKKVHRDWLTRLAITFFFASNLMMFAIAIYMGATETWKNLFGWFCGLLFLPIVFYSAIPFYKSAWQSLKDRRFSADLSIVIAFLWGSGLSYLNLFRGDSHYYFDSTASFLFLILLARFLLDKAQNSIDSELNPSLLFKNAPIFNVKDPSNPGSTKPLLYHQIKKGDEILLNQNQTIPIDLQLSSNAVEVDTSLFSGESLPQTFYQGDEVKAGMVILSSSVSGIAQGSFVESELNSIFEGVINNRHKKTKAHAKAEIYSQRLLITVSILSLAIMIFFGFQDQWAEGFRRALALFTIACPCALALAIPLASVVTLKRSMEQGLFVKSPLFFETIHQITGVAFDKTGTLTQGILEFHSWEPQKPSLHYLEILLALEQNSHHPMAKSITRLLKQENIKPAIITDWHETPGFGITAKVADGNFEIGRIKDENKFNALSGFEVFENNQSLFKVFFRDQIRKESKQLLHWLQLRKLDVCILSGDRFEVVKNIASELGLNSNQYHASLSPLDKSNFLKNAVTNESKFYLMVGDGHNDALALSGAPLSLAVKGCAETSLRAADAYSQKNDLKIILKAFDFGIFYQSLIRQNVRLSLGYNLIAGTLAIAGWVDPLMAAVLMPINSFIVITATLLARPKKIKEL